MSKFKLRNPGLHTISEIVQANTGMDEATLLNTAGQNFPIVNMEKAVKLVYEEVVHKHRKIFIFGDYDIDGISSSYILATLFRHFVYCSPKVRLPYRFTEGYGCQPDAIDEFSDGDLLILVDNGIVAYPAIAKAKAKGMKVVVLDHHLPQLNGDGIPVLPDADVIVDPHLYPGQFNDYCAGGLALKFAEEYARYRSAQTGTDCMQSSYNKELFDRFRAAAAIATIGDAVSLTGENRRIVKEGIEIMNSTPQVLPRGLKVLIEKLDLTGIVDEKAIGFKIGPCINAPGRLYDDGAKKSFSLFFRQMTYKGAYPFVDDLLNDNEMRKEICNNWFETAKSLIANSHMENDYPIVLALDHIPEGVVGIIAGKVAESYKTPAIVLCDDHKSSLLKGSARTYGEVHMKNLLDQRSDLIAKYGGHAGAAGLSVERDNVEDLRKSLNASLGKKPEEIASDTLYDIEISKGNIDAAMEEIYKFKPYGEGNPAPVVLIKDLTLIPDGTEHYRTLSANGIKLNAGNIVGISFDCAEKYLALGAPKKVDLVGNLSKSYFRGNVTRQIEFSDVEISETKSVKTALQLALEKRALERN